MDILLIVDFALLICMVITGYIALKKKGYRGAYSLYKAVWLIFMCYTVALAVYFGLEMFNPWA